MASIFQFSKDGNKDEIVKLLKENSKELLFIKDAYEQTPLHIASFEGHVEIVSTFIKKGAKLDVPDKSGWTPLHCAASCGHFKVCEVLIAKDPALASVEASDGTTPFHYIVRKWDPTISPKVLSMIVKHNPAIVNIAAQNQETPLHNACLKNCLGSIQFLLQQGADVNKRTKSGDTCLTFAIRAGNKNVVKLLLDHGVENSSYDSAYEIATEQKMEDVKTMIQQCRQFLKIRKNHSKVYKSGYLNRLQGKLKGFKKNWIVLDGDKIKIYQSEEDQDQTQLEVTLKEIEKIGTTDEHPNFPHSMSITIKDNPNKLVMAADDKKTMAKWILAIDGLKFKFFDSCINQFLKKSLLHCVYKENFRGGIIKSSFEEEWNYSSDGILSCTEASWNTDGANSLTYLWDGQWLMPGQGTHNLGWGKFNGFIFEWLLGELGEEGTKLSEYYWEETEREYLTTDSKMDWKWTRHFLTLKQGTGEWIVEGEVPEPVVFFLSLLRYSRLGTSSKKESDQAIVTNSVPDVKQE